MKLSCKVIANASKNQIVVPEGLDLKTAMGKAGGVLELRIYLTASPVQGKANKALVELLAEELGVAKSNIEILKGETSNKKIIEINE